MSRLPQFMVIGNSLTTERENFVSRIKTNNMRYLIVLSLALASCGTAKMAVSDNLQADNDAYTVKGRDGVLIKQKLSFGEYSTSLVKRSWTRDRSQRFALQGTGSNPFEKSDLIAMKYTDRNQTLHFSMQDDGHTSQVFCASQFNSTDLQLGNRPNSLLNIGIDLAGITGRASSIYYVQVYNGGGGVPWELMLDNNKSQAKAREYTGVFLRNEKEYYTIKPVTRIEQKGRVREMPFGSIGYEIFNARGEAVAAVSMMDHGTVILKKVDREERFLLANLCAALLLQQQIEG